MKDQLDLFDDLPVQKNPNAKKKGPPRKYTPEELFIRKTWRNMEYRVQKESELVGINEFKTPEDLLQHWNNQKEKYGMKCPYTSVEMIVPKRYRGERKTEGKKRVLVDNNIAVDQIWPGKGYTPMNTVFCSYRFNRNKNSITPDGCQAVIDLYDERTKQYLKYLKKGIKPGLVNYYETKE